MSKDITTRQDIHDLITTFYTRIRKDVYLGPIFNKHIQDWDAHFEHLTNFWERSLFIKSAYEGNPLEIHEKVDKAEGYTINEQHFGVWLNHWVQTLDDLFEGEHTERLKLRARKMGTHIHLHLFHARKNKDD